MTLLALDDPYMLALGRRLEVCRRLLADVDAQQKRFADVVVRHQAVEEGLARAFAEAVLAPLDDARLAQVAKLAGEGALHPDQLAHQAQSAQRAAELRHEQLMADPLAVEPEAESARLQRDIDDIRDHGKALQDRVHRVEGAPHFRQLREACFGLEGGPGWWTLSHHRMKKQADLLLKLLRDVHAAESFGELVHLHEAERQALLTLEESLHQAEGRLRRLQAWTADEAQARHQRDHAYDAVLQERAFALYERLTDVAPDVIVEGDDPLALWQRRCWAHRTRVRYLLEATAHLIGQTRDTLRSMEHELEDKRAHPELLSRVALPPAADVDAQTIDLERQMQARLRQYGQTMMRLDTFDPVTSDVPRDGQVWWDLMCDGIDGSYIDEVAMHRAMRPARRHTSAQDTWATASNNAADTLAERLARAHDVERDPYADPCDDEPGDEGELS